MDVRQLPGRLQQRGAQEWRVGSARALYKAWTLMGSEAIAAELRQSLVYSCELPSTAPPNDPIFANPHIPADAMPTRRHSVYRLQHTTYIEPRCGYALVAPRTLLAEAFARTECLYDPDRALYFPGTPSLLRLLKAERGQLPVRKERTVISLRRGFDDNIYHILSDVLPRLALFDEHGIDRDIPVPIAWR